MEFGIEPEQLCEPFSVSTLVGVSILATRVYRDCVVTLCGRYIVADLIELRMVNFDVIMGMDWLYSCFAKLNCLTRIVRFEFPNEPVIEWKGDDMVPNGRFISYLKATKMINKGCIYHLVRVTDTGAEAPTLEFVPVVNEFPRAFPDELPGILPDREIDFGIDVLPDTHPISIPPYRIAPAKLKELKEQLRDLLEKGFIRPSEIGEMWGVVSGDKLGGQWKVEWRQSVGGQRKVGWGHTWEDMSGKDGVRSEERLKTTQSRQKSYSDIRRRDLEFKEGDYVFLKVSPRKGIMRFGRKGKLSPRYIGPYPILERIGLVAYRLALLPELSSMHPVFHMSMLKQYFHDPSHVLEREEIEVDDTLTFEEVPEAIVDRKASDDKMEVREKSESKIDYAARFLERYLFEKGRTLLETNMEESRTEISDYWFGKEPQVIAACIGVEELMNLN
ncbi:uncharacterized protein [Nicotiana tomentosiformis]|uniref:uncharacterized protein n=1 Tax=Nicotiana tomentosiformis TaxID=4098 RepID=UPI00388C8D85